MKNLLALVCNPIWFYPCLPPSPAYGAEIKVDMLNKRADGQKMV